MERAQHSSRPSKKSTVNHNTRESVTNQRTVHSLRHVMECKDFATVSAKTRSTLLTGSTMTHGKQFGHGLGCTTRGWHPHCGTHRRVHRFLCFWPFYGIRCSHFPHVNVNREIRFPNETVFLKFVTRVLQGNWLYLILHSQSSTVGTYVLGTENSCFLATRQSSISYCPFDCWNHPKSVSGVRRVC